MWQRFTERARRVIFYSQEEAQKHGEGFVSTEHILLGLVRESDTTAARALAAMHISIAAIREKVEMQLPTGQARPSQDMTLTPRSKRVIDLAYDAARDLNNNYIGTEHLLLGMVREGDGLAGRVLISLGADLNALQTIVAELQNKESKPLAPNPPADTRYEPYNFLGGRHIVLHLVLATIGDETTIAGRAIREIAEDLQSLQGGLWRLLMEYGRRGVYVADGTELALILQATTVEAKAMLDPQIRPHHVLIAAAGQEGSTVAATLTAVGATPEKLREVVTRLLSENQKS